MALKQLMFSNYKLGLNSNLLRYYNINNQILYKKSKIYKNFNQHIFTTPIRKNFKIKGIQSNPFENVPIETGPANPSKLFKTFIFSIAFSTTSFVTVTIWEYEQVRARMRNIKNGAIPFNWIKQKIHGGQKQMQTWYKEVDTWWNSLSTPDKLFIPLCGLNTLVFLLWRIPRFQPMMIKYFCSNPAARAVCWPMVLSTFSHYSAFHLFANMYVLHSFMNAAVLTLGKEQFLGFYLSAGVIAAFSSYCYKILSRKSGLSLGASGAIMGILAYVCTQYPNTQLSIIFLPMYQFSAGLAIKCIMGLDLVGLLLGWRYFDHAAHLGGALFGLLWCSYGVNYVWPKREIILKEYHKIRSPPPTK